MFNYRLSDLPGFGKLFVAIFTALMLCVTLWAALIFYVDEGVVDQNHLPAYLTQDSSQPADSANFPQENEATEGEDSSAVLAPIWDTTLKGQEVNLDTASPEESSTVRKAIGEQEEGDETIDMSNYDGDTDDTSPDQLTHLRKNVGLAHTHINGQTLLFFALGAVFLFSSAPPRTKKYVYWIFGIAVLLHNIGLTGRGFYSICDDILSVSGVTLLVIIVYMSFLIFVDLAKSGRTSTVEPENPKTKS